jgi:hypothetical protein
VPGAITFRGPADVERFSALLAEFRAGALAWNAIASCRGG